MERTLSTVRMPCFQRSVENGKKVVFTSGERRKRLEGDFWKVFLKDYNFHVENLNLQLVNSEVAKIFEKLCWQISIKCILSCLSKLV